MQPTQFLGNCLNCGERLLYGKEFCGSCGANRERCATCFATIFASDRFCSACGHSVVTDREASNANAGNADGTDSWPAVVRRLQAAIAGEFEIIRELGRGGMGAVYLARETALDRYVAMKVISPALLVYAGMIERIEREARTLAKLVHPNIVTIHAVRRVDDVAFFTMQYVAGRSLETLLARSGPLPVTMVRGLLFEIGNALAYAHRRGVVHRDVKPANILIDGDGVAMVTDFGIAKVIDDRSAEQTNGVIGTPTYMSPEQCFAHPATAASDQYSLGILAYELLTGKPPFSGSSFVVMQAHTERPVPAISTNRLDCPPELESAVLRMLEKEPEARWPTIQHALAELRAAPLLEGGQDRRELIAMATSESVGSELGLWGVAETRDRSGTQSPRVEAPPEDEWIDARDTRVARLTMGAPAPESDQAPAAHNHGESFTQIFDSPAQRASIEGFSVALILNAAPSQAQIGTRVRCTHFPFTVGRAPTADLCIKGDEALSREHVQIRKDESGFFIQDVSLNGVYVNGRQLKATAEPIRIGSRVTLSRSTSFTFVADVSVLPSLSGRLLDGRYRLGDLKHESIKGSTYLATDVRLDRALVVKVFSPVLMNLTQYRDEFTKEAEVAARLKHPHICKVIDFGEAVIEVDGRTQMASYLCTEYMEGGSIAARLDAESTHELRLVARWIEQISGALEHAHRNGVVHGDIRPACIVFDRDETPYLTDFALASVGAMKTRGVVGTADYLAPEQWVDGQRSESTDQYSLAVLAYVLVTGARPHEGQSDPLVRERNFRRGPTPAHEEAKIRGREGVSHAVSAVLNKAMSFRSTDRFQSVLNFGIAFAQAVTASGRRVSQPCIFVSYQRQVSAGWANYLADALRERHGCSVFIDTQARDGAPRIPDRLKAEIKDCDVFVCLLAPGTLQSEWVRQEIGLAYQYKKPMVPVFHEDFHPNFNDMREARSVRALLNFAAVHLLDRRNIHVNHTITDLADRVRRLLTPEEQA